MQAVQPRFHTFNSVSLFSAKIEESTVFPSRSTVSIFLKREESSSCALPDREESTPVLVAESLAPSVFSEAAAPALVSAPEVELPAPEAPHPENASVAAVASVSAKSFCFF